jgi:hypothetical protein
VSMAACCRDYSMKEIAGLELEAADLLSDSPIRGIGIFHTLSPLNYGRAAAVLFNHRLTAGIST